MEEVPAKDVPLSIDVTRDVDVITLRLTGEIDMATAGQLQDALHAALAAEPAVLIVDLEPVRFLASMGLSVLARADRAARESGTELRIVATSGIVVRTMELTGLIDELAVFGSYSDAVVGRDGNSQHAG